MIRFNLQFHAKTASQMAQYRKSKAVEQFTKESGSSNANKPEEKTSSKKNSSSGEAVTAVSKNETYAIYKIEHGKEVRVIKDGTPVTRTGEDVLKKMEYNKRLGVWISKAKGLKYRVRKIK